MKKSLLALSLIVLLLGQLPAARADSGSWWKETKPAGVLDQRLKGKKWAGRIKWDDGYLEVVATGVADPKKAVNAAHAETLALKTARYLGYERLLEVVKGVRLTSRTILKKEVLADSRLLTRVRGLVAGARVISERVEHRPDGSVVARVRLGLLLKGPGSLSEESLRWWRERNIQPEPRYVPRVKPKAVAKPYTGLVVVAKGIGARPAMFPRLVEKESGRELYGPDQVDRNIAIDRGVVSYTTSLSKAIKQKRTGDNPLVIRAVSTGGQGKSRLIITRQDAVKLYAADLAADFLRHCRVTIVIN